MGGVIESLREDGFLAEFGPNTVLETSPRIGELVRELGLEERRADASPASNKRYVVRGGKPISLPDSPFAFATCPLFSVRAKLRLLREPFVSKRTSSEDESLADFVVRRLGREFLDYAINPFVGGVYAGDPKNLAVEHAFPKLRELEDRYGSLLKGQVLGAKERSKRASVSKKDARKLSFDEGLQVLTAALGEHLSDQIQLGSAVCAITEEDAGWSVETAGGETRQHAAVLLCLPTHKLSAVKVELRGGSDLSLLDEIQYPPVASVVLGFRREAVRDPLDGFGVLIPEVEGFNSLGCLYSSSLFEDRAPPGHVLLTTYVGGCRSPEYALRSPEDLVKLVLEDQRRLLGVSEAPVFQSVRTYSKAIPQYNVGYGRYKTLMSEVESSSPGIYFAGHYRDGISISDSILSGLNIGERIGRDRSAG